MLTHAALPLSVFSFVVFLFLLLHAHAREIVFHKVPPLGIIQAVGAEERRKQLYLLLEYLSHLLSA